MKIKKGCLFSGLTAFIIVVLLIVFLFQYRHFYTIGNMNFTFWKTGEGCYITPYKYCGMTKPKNEYIKTSNLGGIIIFVSNDSLFIFSKLSYEQDSNKTEFNIPSFKYKYFPENREDLYESLDLIDYYKNLNYPFIDVYLKEMSVYVGNNDSKDK